MNSQFHFDEDIDLTHFDAAFSSDKAADNFQPLHTIPDGRYEVVVVEAQLTRSQSSGNPMIRWTMRITGQTFRDRILRKHRAITEKSIPYLKKELEVCGLQLRKISDLKSRVQEMEGVELEVVKVTKGEDSNIYFNRSLSSKSQPDGLTDDLPF
jgi:hypothetical protein